MSGDASIPEWVAAMVGRMALEAEASRLNFDQALRRIAALEAEQAEPADS